MSYLKFGNHSGALYISDIAHNDYTLGFGDMSHNYDVHIAAMTSGVDPDNGWDAKPGLVLRYVDSNNYLRIWYNCSGDPTTIGLDGIEGGDITFHQEITGTQRFFPNEQLQKSSLVLDNDKIGVFYEGIKQGLFDLNGSGSSLETNSKFGFTMANSPQDPSDHFFLLRSANIGNPRMPLHLYGHVVEAGGSNLYIAGLDTDSDSSTLFTEGSISELGSIDLFTQGLALDSDDISLIVEGLAASSSGSTSLIVNGSIVFSDTTALYTLGPVVNFDTFIDAYQFSSGTTDQWTDSGDPTYEWTIYPSTLLFTSDSGGTSLFIGGLISDNESTKLFTQGSVENSESTNMFVDGHTVILGDIDVFIEGHSVLASSTALYASGTVAAPAASGLNDIPWWGRYQESDWSTAGGDITTWNELQNITARDLTGYEDTFFPVESVSSPPGLASAWADFAPRARFFYVLDSGDITDINADTTGTGFVVVRADAIPGDGTFMAFTSRFTTRHLRCRFANDAGHGGNTIKLSMSTTNANFLHSWGEGGMSTGVWYVIAFRQDGTELRIWVDGVKQAKDTTFVSGGTDSDWFSISNQDMTTFTVGGAAEHIGASTSHERLDGGIAEVAYYDGALTDAEIAQISSDLSDLYQ